MHRDTELQLLPLKHPHFSLVARRLILVHRSASMCPCLDGTCVHSRYCTILEIKKGYYKRGGEWHFAHHMLIPGTKSQLQWIFFHQKMSEGLVIDSD
jgi:hypothetical protein